MKQSKPKAIERFSDYIFGSVYHKRLYNKPVCTVEIQDKKTSFELPRHAAEEAQKITINKI